MDLFAHAKKLLALQPRVENRQWRKNGARAQNARPSSEDCNMATPTTSPPTTIAADAKGVDLLLPLLMDDVRGTHAAVTVTQNGRKPVPLDVTPSSTHDSPPSAPPAADWAKPVKREPQDGVEAYVRPRTSNLTASLQAAPRATPAPPVCSVPGPMPVSRGVLARATPAGFSGVASAGTHVTAVNPSNGSSVGVSSSGLSSTGMGVTSVGASAISVSSVAVSVGGRPPAPSPAVPASAPAGFSRGARPTECSNCHTLKTPLWRKDPAGNTLCNACGLFYKLHGTTRPLSLKTDVIKKRSLRRLSTTPRGGNGAASTAPAGATPLSLPTALDSRREAPTPPQATPADLRPKNVPILPKPPGSAGSTPALFGKAQAQMSTPSSPYSAGAMQFKRKKSDANIVELARVPLLLAMSAGPTIKRGFLATNINRRTSTTSLRKQLATPNGSTPANGSNGFSSNGFTSNGYSNGFTPNSFTSNGFAPNGYGSVGANSAYGTPSDAPYGTPNNTYGTPPARLSFTHGSYFDHPSAPLSVPLSVQHVVAALPHDPPLSVPLPSSFSSSGQVTARPSFIAPSDLAGYSGSLRGMYASPKNNDDMDTDDFFKNYTLLHPDAPDDDLMPLDDSTVPAMGGRYEIKPTSTKSTLTHGLKEVSQRGMTGNNYNDANENSDLDWLKFEI